MKKLKSSYFTKILLSSVFIMSFLTPLAPKSLTQPPRIINVVYDDSNSMLMNRKLTWSYARYAMQVFAALMEKDDILNIYIMSDHAVSKTNDPTYSIKGSASVESRVKEIYDMSPTMTGGTPFQPVINAYNDLPKMDDQTSENWLIVLSDGAFDNYGGKKVDLNQYYRSFVAEKPYTSVATLAIGDTAALPDETEKIFVYRAYDQTEVTSQIAQMAQRVFNRNSLTVSADRKIDLDGVPMKELIVFAQGKNIVINSIKSLSANRKSVEVKMTAADSVKATINTNYASQVQSAVLNGVVATFTPFTGDYFNASGKLEIDLSGEVEQIQVFYKPDVKVKITLVDAQGNDIDASKIVTGEYSIKYGFIDPKTGAEVESDLLLGNPKFNVSVKNNGETIQATDNKFSIVRGTLEIGVIATYLTYNAIYYNDSFTVQEKGSELAVTIKADDYTLKGLETGPGILVTIQQNGQPLSKEKWETINPEDIKVIPGEGEGDEWTWTVERGQEVSTFIIHPRYAEGGIYKTQTGNIPLKISVAMTYDEQVSGGKLLTTINIVNDVSLMEKIQNWIENYGLQTLLMIITAIILFGYIPGVKKYLPKKWRRSRHKIKITCSPKRRGTEDKFTGKFEKTLLSTIVPYVAQKGSLRFVPPSAGIQPSRLQLKAAGGNTFYITNIKSFVNKPDIKINNELIKEDMIKKGFKRSASIEIKCENATHIYKCSPNM